MQDEYRNRRPFALLDDEQFSFLFKDSEEIRHSAGNLLLARGGSRIEKVFVIREGEVEEYFQVNGRRVYRRWIEEGATVGVLSLLFNDAVPLLTVRALGDLNLHALPALAFRECFDRNPEFAGHFIREFGRSVKDEARRSVFFGVSEGLNRAAELFVDGPVETVTHRSFARCRADATLAEAAVEMSRAGQSAVWVREDDGSPAGVVTDSAFRSRVVARGLSTDEPVSRVMSDSVVSLPARGTLVKALWLMVRERIQHLALTADDGRLVGVTNDSNSVLAETHAPVFLINAIREADDFQHAVHHYSQLPGLVRAFEASGARAETFIRLIAAFADGLLDKSVELAVDELGTPPARFALLLLGREGRKEPTLRKVQYNAIVFEDAAEGREASVQNYFQDLGDRVCRFLNQAGHPYREDDVMARNPRWCQPLAIWKRYFTEWARTVNPWRLLRFNDFFDLERGCGDRGLVEELRNHLSGVIPGNTRFFRNLALNGLRFRPPDDFYRPLEETGGSRSKRVIDFRRAMIPVVDLARLEALRSGIGSSNTLDRLHRLYLSGNLEEAVYRDCVEVHTSLMRMRLEHQVRGWFDGGREPEDHAPEEELDLVERHELDDLFEKITGLQERLREESERS